MSRWDDVEAFVAVVEEGGFSAGARALGTSPSFASRAIQRLERRLALQLLHRTTRQLRLTDSGRRYFEECRSLVTALDAAERSVQAMEAAPRGLIRMSCATYFGEHYLAPAVNDFMLQYPEISVELELTNRVVDLVQEGFDLAVRLGSLKDSSLVARRLAPRRLHVCASPGYLARHGHPASPEALARHQCLVGSTDYWTFSINGRREDRRVRGRLRCNNGLALLDAALKGLGIAQLPAHYVAGPLARGELVEVLPDYRFTDAGVYAVYPWSRYPAPKVRAMVDFLLAHFQTPASAERAGSDASAASADAGR
ncbi:LysR family transcriptional regulator [Arhodomonas aquaeolei]|uniref:LysR family transcriptional regulator n=1 Tax=Arhodomonas aquaeolei TaxID=2369 RepID=UPI0021677292|nr:LysR family transcriptional regulator [Arhodomonas aquaeolei]MCS4505904.1 LysR family transcriptional regulator [Arhodomonas aquaeolei]